MARNSKPPEFEHALEELEKLVETLERGDLPLDEALRRFERGVELTRHCQGALKAAQQRVEVLLRRNNGEWEAAPFAPGEEAGARPAQEAAAGLAQEAAARPAQEAAARLGQEAAARLGLEHEGAPGLEHEGAPDRSADGAPESSGEAAPGRAPGQLTAAGSRSNAKP